MKFYDNSKAEMKVIHEQMVDVNNIECAYTIREVKRLCNELGHPAGMLKGDFVEGKKIK